MTKELLLLGILLLYTSVEAKNLLEEIKAWPNLSQVAALIEQDKILPQLMKTTSYTAFMPTDAAMDKYDGPKNGNLIRYHLANIPFRVQDLPEELNTELSGNPWLYVTRIPSGKASLNGWEDNHYFINNAEITSANHNAKTEMDNLPQVLHIVDQVIAPTIAQTTGGVPVRAQYLNPDARKLLEKPNLYGLVDFNSITDFERRVSELKLLDVFGMSGKNTFFIPINQALNAIRDDQDLIDKQVIHGHIVPGKVLFTRTVQSPTDESESLAFTDNLKVLISMENVTSSTADGGKAYYVKSNTVAGDLSHDKGTVIARIVKGNIPVKNGVVHLIDRPLMVVASNIVSYLQEEGGQLSRFNKLMRDHYADLANFLIVEQDLTLFAPSNAAFDKVNSKRLDQIILNKERLVKLLNLHILKRRLTTDEIIDQSSKEIFQEETLSNSRKLFFAVNPHNGLVPIISLDGGGVNATITTPDIAAKNGVIHIINRILGIPSQTVYEKLATDPMLSATFNLSTQEHWNERLKSREERFTIFAPSDTAWDMIHRRLPSAFKKLFMGEFPYHVRYILERHMIVGKDLSLEELVNLTTNSTPRPGGITGNQMQMTRGKIYFQARVKPRGGDSTLAEDYDTELYTDRDSTLAKDSDTENSTDSTLAKDSDTENSTEADGLYNSNEYFIEWNGISARVTRPDVECVNGIVHVVDKVLMMNRDVTVAGGSSTIRPVHELAALLSTLITVAFARALHH